MTMKIYGSPMSRASRVLWCAKELGVPFEHVDVPWENLKKADFLAINPNGKVPGFSDGDLKLFESLAINLYIAKKYGTGELYPTNPEDEARILQWTIWAATEVEPFALPALLFVLGIRGTAEEAGCGRGKDQARAQSARRSSERSRMGGRQAVLDRRSQRRIGGIDGALRQDRYFLCTQCRSLAGSLLGAARPRFQSARIAREP